MSSAARTSAILTDLAARPGERLSVGEVLAVLRDRAFALLIVLLGLPNCLPMPPPIPLVCGLLLALVAVQIIAARPAPWLPRSLLHRSVARADVERAVSRAAPVFRRLERYSRPRMAVLNSGAAMRLIGVTLLILSIGIVFALPPIVGQIPLGIAVCLMGLGLVERDGILVILGAMLGLLGLALNVGFIYTVLAAAFAIAE